LEQPITRRVKLRAGYMSNLSDGLVLLNRSVPNPDTGAAANVLSGIGQARYRQLEITTRMGLAMSASCSSPMSTAARAAT